MKLAKQQRVTDANAEQARQRCATVPYWVGRFLHGDRRLLEVSTGAISPRIPDRSKVHPRGGQIHAADASLKSRGEPAGS